MIGDDCVDVMMTAMMMMLSMLLGTMMRRRARTRMRMRRRRRAATMMETRTMLMLMRMMMNMLVNGDEREDYGCSYFLKHALDAVVATGYHDEEYEDEDNAQNQD